MEEDINALLGVQESNSNRAPVKKNNRYQHENALRIVANIVLMLGIIGTATLLFISAFEERAVFFLLSVAVFLNTIVVWGLLNVICNISVNIYKIRDKVS